MLISNPPYPFWSAWVYFSGWEHLFLILLGVLSVHVLYSAAMTVLAVRKGIISAGSGNSVSAENVLVILRRRSRRVDKLIATAFFLFGVVLFESLQWAYVTIDNTKTPTGWLILRDFLPHFAFAFNVFFIFLVLHVVGWLVSNHINRLALQLKPLQAA